MGYIYVKVYKKVKNFNENHFSSKKNIKPNYIKTFVSSFLKIFFQNILLFSLTL